MLNKTQLITYVDRLAGSFDGLRELVAGPFSGVFGGVHLLPFFDPVDGADAGFDPIDHEVVDPRLGSWRDVDALGETIELMADLIVNHVSSDSPRFREYLERGEDAGTAAMFLTMHDVFPGGAREEDLLAIHRPRPGLPFTPVRLANRSRRLMWTTFTPRQIDVDVHAAPTRAYHDAILDRFAAHGIRMVRLDAVGYAVKTPGTSSFMTPETFAFIDELSRRAHARGIEVLVEVHAFWRRQIEIARNVDRVYDFALPPLVLHALYTGRAGRLCHWLGIRPRNAVTVLDTHDGIGVVDVGPDTDDVHHLGLLTASEVDELVEGIHASSGGASRRATGEAASNVDLYQVNCTYYDALGREDDAYLIARMIQIWLPGVPQIYYVGLLAGGNDLELLERTGVGRDINRRWYTRAEIDDALTRPVVRALCALLRLRNVWEAFEGEWELLDGADDEIRMRWTTSTSSAALDVQLAARSFEVRIADDGGTWVARTIEDLVALDERLSGRSHRPG